MSTFPKHLPPHMRDPMRRHQGPGPKPQVPFSNAPAARVQNLKKLEDCCGPDLLAIKLGIPLGRLREMLDGVNFSSEMAYHIETTLALDAGFMDKPASSLSQEDQVRLRLPPSDDLHEDLFTPVDRAVAANTPAAPTAPPAPAPVLDKAPDVVNTPPVVPTAETAQPEITQKDIAMTEAVTQSTIPHVSDSQEEALRAVRRENFRVLTSPKGFKSRLGDLTGLSPANISHRLHGHKIFDKETGDFFCSKLGLPMGWFETPHSLEDIPSSVIQLLSGAVPASVTPVAPQPRTVSKTAMPKPASVPLARTKAQKSAAGEQAAAMPPALALSAASRGGEQDAQAVAPAVAAPAKPGRRRAAPAVAAPVVAAPALVAPAVQAPVAAPVVAPVVSAPAYAPSAAAVVERPAVAPAAVTGAGPLAQAALAVLTLKIQGGRLSEERALSLLTELAAL